MACRPRPLSCRMLFYRLLELAGSLTIPCVTTIWSFAPRRPMKARRKPPGRCGHPPSRIAQRLIAAGGALTGFRQGGQEAPALVKPPIAEHRVTVAKWIALSRETPCLRPGRDSEHGTPERGVSHRQGGREPSSGRRLCPARRPGSDRVRPRGSHEVVEPVGAS